MTANNHTFVIPAYGNSIHLEACIRALKNQTIKSQIIITTSTPSSFIENIAKRYNLKVIIKKNSTGIASDWTFACSCCDSNYFTITHQDDIYLPKYAKNLLTPIKRGPKSLFAFSDYRKF